MTELFYDAILILSYGGPENKAEVGPFLDRLFAGKRLPDAARHKAEEKYSQLGNISPIGSEARLFVKRLQNASSMAVYLGNLYSPPLIEETVRNMVDKGARSVLTIVASAFGSPQSCRRYRDRLKTATMGVNRAQFHIVPPFFHHPRFIKAQSNLLLSLLAEDELHHGGWDARSESPIVLFSAHSLPVKDATESGYESQLLWSAQKIAEGIGLARSDWNLVYQSRSGRPDAPWTGPGIEDFIRDHKTHHPKKRRYLIVPIGFFFENLETVDDLDRQLIPLATELDLDIKRAGTVARSPEMIEMILDLLKSKPLFSPCDSPAGTCFLSCRQNNRAESLVAPSNAPRHSG